MNLSLYAEPSTSSVSPHERLAAIQDGFDPAASNDLRHGAYGNWPATGTQWVQYEWSKPVCTHQSEVYWWEDGRGIKLPAACRLLYWVDGKFLPVPSAKGLGIAKDLYNMTCHDEITTTKLRLEFDGVDKSSTGILEWKVADSGKSPRFAPRVTAGGDRVVVVAAKTWLVGDVKGGGADSIIWSKQSGPGNVIFEHANALQTSATFTTPGHYGLKLTAGTELTASDTLQVEVVPPAPAIRQLPVYTKSYQLDSPLWNARAKALINGWLPHCVSMLADPNVTEGGISNFVEASNKIAGRPSKPHVGSPWTNAYVLNTYESICVALALDPQGDKETAKGQAALRKTMEEWTPILLAAQEPDGYLQTRFTLGAPNEQGKTVPRWTYRGDHEGYVGGYFIEAAIAHYLLYGGTDHRMLDAAKRLADCWDRNLGPAPKKPWFDGHQEIEQALARLGRLLNETEGTGKGDRYIALAKFLLDSRTGGDSYDQSHLPVVRQYEALGHAVRAMYTYSAMADIVLETGDPDYQSAVSSLHANLIDKKYYVTGGVGSGETSEGFGGNYSLRNGAYCESCSGCGEVFFQHKLNLVYRDASYADLLEETLYNAVLGSVDLVGKNFIYTNPLDSSQARYPWHVCPCCIGNIPRTLLMLPEWMYARGKDGIDVNLFIGSTVTVDHVVGTSVRMTQKTDYPWSGAVSITVNPAETKEFTLRVRVPRHDASKLYQNSPATGGLVSLTVNGQPVTPQIVHGYAVITRQWKTGDKVDLVLPLAVQRVKCDERVADNRGRVALRVGPLLYNIESADQNIEAVLPNANALTTQWNSGLLGGVMTINGAFADGSKMTAIPNFARLNRGGRSLVWIKDK
ncbi:MAG: beta-L-arabinofuranosidase domain-containing protein [Verrucomicrobiota bacterium]